ncbi:protein SRG1-like [Tasmannia lanceolata]|uniref:protein SRG1-like n=1 Tax=Tasmannia lanceolata TaxID=3420 RepID=UPI004063BB67
MESAKSVVLGSSILVPSVKELAKEQLITVPPRYVRQDLDLPSLNSASVSLPDIPVIDMERLLHGYSMALELERLHSACKEWGFFQLVNHGVDSWLVEKMKRKIEEFFGLPLEEKKRVWQQVGEVEGYGQAFVVSEEQKLDWADLFFLSTLPVHLRKPNLFNNISPSFRDTLDAYSLELQKLAMKVLVQMARALEMDAEEMSELFEDGYQAMRMNCYPPCPKPEKVIGLTPHSDAVGLTLLLQVNEMEGLQIRKDGMWVPVKPLPNAFIVNIGDILEMVSNGIYRSIEHRATVNSVRERLSIATFYSPRLTTEIGPAFSLINPQNPALFKRIGVEDYFKGLFTKELKGKSYLDYMRIDNEKGNTISD